MNSLAELQLRFQEAILHDDPTPGLFVGQGERLADRFGVYLRAYRARLIEALGDNFPVLRRALGDDAFGALARAYVDAHPSHFRSIRWFGDSLVDFLAAFPERLPHVALVDLARMDWAMRAAFDAADSALLAIVDLAALPLEDWPSRCFRPVPSLQVLDLTWQVEPIWKALNDDAGAATAEPQALPHVLLVWRPALDCCWRSAPACEAAALRALTRAASFAECCTLIAESGEPEPAKTALGFLQCWISEGLLARD